MLPSKPKVAPDSGYSLDIEGVTVHFPYEPYNIQKDFMRKVILCLENGTNGLLESPTGTGKTLSLLCSSLAWIKARGKHAPQVADSNCSPVHRHSKQCQAKPVKLIYATRTHKQLSQVAKELKSTKYKDCLTSYLASRERYCLNGRAMFNSFTKEKRPNDDINAICLLEKRDCSYASEDKRADVVYKLTSHIEHFQDTAVIDIEDLRKIGKNCGVCPYYAAQEISRDKAEVILTPYSYLFEHVVDIDLENAIVILDEGHNAEAACEEAASTSISSTCILDLIADLEELVSSSAQLEKSRLNSGDRHKPHKLAKDIDPEVLDVLREMITLADVLLRIFNREFKEIRKRQAWADISSPNVIDIYFFHAILMQQLNVTSQEIKTYLEATKSLIRFYASQDGIEPTTMVPFLKAIQTFNHFFQSLLCHEGLNMQPEEFKRFIAQNYRVTLERDTDRKHPDPRKEEWILSVYCLNPAIIVNRLRNRRVRSIIITSGTLAPMDTFENEMGIKFPQTLCNLHVIQPSQLMVFAVSSNGDEQLDGALRNVRRRGTKYYDALGRAIKRYATMIPAGMLLFFKSYKTQEECIKQWQESGVFSEIEKYKKVFKELRDRSKFDESLEDYKKTIDAGDGAILAAVFRGKASEGLDLADDYCRAAILIGLPYPYAEAPRMILKPDYLKCLENSKLTPEIWHENQMLRAMNQAVGRIIRHRNDFGIVFLLDMKYKRKKSDLSKWLHQYVRKGNDCNPKQCESFFRKNAHLRLLSQKSDPPPVEETVQVSRGHISIDLSSDESCSSLDETIAPRSPVDILTQGRLHELKRFPANFVRFGGDVLRVLEEKKPKTRPRSRSCFADPDIRNDTQLFETATEWMCRLRICGDEEHTSSSSLEHDESL